MTSPELRRTIDAFWRMESPRLIASLTRMLADPRNALARPLIIEELAQHASAVRSAHERLAALSPGRWREIA